MKNSRTLGSLFFATAIVFGTFANASVQAAPIYKSADFSGGVFSVVSSFKTELSADGYNASLFNCSTCSNPIFVSGNLIFDSTVPTTGPYAYWNADSIGAIANVPNPSIFTINIGSIGLHFGDAGTAGGGGPFVQYHNGVYNGFAFTDIFNSPNGTSLTFSLQGGTFSLYNTSTYQNLLTGYLNTGNGGLTNIASFTAPVPEPETYAMLMAGLGLMGFVARRRRTQ